MTLIDSHAHLEAVKNLNEALARAKKVGLSKIITVGTSIDTSKNACDLAFSCSRPALEVYATVGIHPRDGKIDVEKFGVNKCIEQLRKIIKTSNKVVGIGECGLDYFEGKTSEEEKKFQRDLFKRQIKLASELNLPLVVHCRNAWTEIFDLLTFNDERLTNLRGVFHSFTGGVKEAKKAISLGFYVSFSGILTFMNAKNVQEAARIVPNDRILVETDSPYLCPEPLRGQINVPANVKMTANFLSNLRNISPEAIYAQTSANAQKLFCI
jgi:TatD DNase family protein